MTVIRCSCISQKPPNSHSRYQSRKPYSRLPCTHEKATRTHQTNQPTNQPLQPRNPYTSDQIRQHSRHWVSPWQKEKHGRHASPKLSPRAPTTTPTTDQYVLCTMDYATCKRLLITCKRPLITVNTLGVLCCWLLEIAEASSEHAKAISSNKQVVTLSQLPDVTSVLYIHNLLST